MASSGLAPAGPDLSWAKDPELEAELQVGLGAEDDLMLLWHTVLLSLSQN